jgi:hypothetical protein
MQSNFLNIFIENLLIISSSIVDKERFKDKKANKTKQLFGQQVGCRHYCTNVKFTQRGSRLSLCNT